MPIPCDVCLPDGDFTIWHNPAMRKVQGGVPHCRECRHYYITFDRNFPYGCRELGFKSAREPMRDVIESSGEICLYFSPDEKRSPRKIGG